MHMQCTHKQQGIGYNLLFPFFLFAQPRNHKLMDLTVCAFLPLCAHFHVRQCANLSTAHVFFSPPHPLSGPSHVHQVKVCRELIRERIRI